jgi:hypothetical protein
MLLAVALVLVVAGCGGGGSSSGGSSGSGSSTSTPSQSTDAAAENDNGSGEGETGVPSPTKESEQAEENTRAAVKKIVDAKLPEFGLSSDQIACVDENIATMTGQEMSAGVTRPSGGETAAREEETAENYLGPLAKGCL